MAARIGRPAVPPGSPSSLLRYIVLLLGLPLVLPMLLRKARYVLAVSFALYLLAPVHQCFLPYASHSGLLLVLEAQQRQA